MIITNFEFNTSHDIYLARQEVYSMQNWYSLSKEKKKEDYVWDEDLTVRQNREKTIQYNNDIEEEIKKRQAEFSESLANLNHAVIRYIMGEFLYTDIECTEAQAKVIWDYCRCEHEDDAQNWISTISELIQNFLGAKNA